MPPPSSASGRPKRCFVVMGFGRKTDYATGRTLDLDKSYRNVIKPAVEGKGLVCVRADEISHSGVIDVPMYEELYEADLVVADLSTVNPNAIYEVGVRHALRPRTTILMAEEGFFDATKRLPPFDLSRNLFLIYRHMGEDIGYDEVMDTRKALSERIEAVLDADDPDSPVYTYLRDLTPPQRKESPASTTRRQSEVRSGGERREQRSSRRGTTVFRGTSDEDEALLSSGGPYSFSRDVGSLDFFDVEDPSLAGSGEEGGSGDTDGSGEDGPGPDEELTLSQLVGTGESALSQSDFEAAKAAFERALGSREDGGFANLDPYLIQRLVLATYKSEQPDPVAALREAMDILQLLDPRTSNDPETVALAGAIEKRLFERRQGDAHLDRAIRHYSRGFHLRNDWYNGINLAYLHNLRADTELDATEQERVADLVTANRIRREVLDLCESELQTIRREIERADDRVTVPEDNGDRTAQTLRNREQEFWCLVTMAEAHFGLGDDQDYASLRDDAQTLQETYFPEADWMMETFEDQLAKLADLRNRYADLL